MIIDLQDSLVSVSHTKLFVWLLIINLKIHTHTHIHIIEST